MLWKFTLRTINILKTRTDSKHWINLYYFVPYFHCFFRGKNLFESSEKGIAKCLYFKIFWGSNCPQTPLVAGTGFHSHPLSTLSLLLQNYWKHWSNNTIVFAILIAGCYATTLCPSWSRLLSKSSPHRATISSTGCIPSEYSLLGICHHLRVKHLFTAGFCVWFSVDIPLSASPCPSTSWILPWPSCRSLSSICWSTHRNVP